MCQARYLQSEWILVVEDEPDIRNSTRDLLTEDGYTVASAESLASARAKLALERFACMVLDLRLPDGTGDELLRELSTLPVAPAVVVISTGADATDVAHHYGVLSLIKPFELEILISAVKVAISQKMRPIVRTMRDAPTLRRRPVP